MNKKQANERTNKMDSMTTVTNSSEWTTTKKASPTKSLAEIRKHCRLGCKSRHLQQNRQNSTKTYFCDNNRTTTTDYRCHRFQKDSLSKTAPPETKKQLKEMLSTVFGLNACVVFALLFAQQQQSNNGQTNAACYFNRTTNGTVSIGGCVNERCPERYECRQNDKTCCLSSWAVSGDDSDDGLLLFSGAGGGGDRADFFSRAAHDTVINRDRRQTKTEIGSKQMLGQQSAHSRLVSGTAVPDGLVRWQWFPLEKRRPWRLVKVDSHVEGGHDFNRTGDGFPNGTNYYESPTINGTAKMGIDKIWVKNKLINGPQMNENGVAEQRQNDMDNERNQTVATERKQQTIKTDQLARQKRQQKQIAGNKVENLIRTSSNESETTGHGTRTGQKREIGAANSDRLYNMDRRDNSDRRYNGHQVVRDHNNSNNTKWLKVERNDGIKNGGNEKNAEKISKSAANGSGTAEEKGDSQSWEVDSSDGGGT